MRKLCPICQTEPKYSYEYKFVVPTNWTLPNVNYIKFCPKCGFIWYDNDKTQADYDKYYQERYGYGLDNIDDKERMWQLASTIKRMVSKKDIKIVDVGSNSGYFEEHLRELGFTNASTVRVKEPLGTDNDLLTISHVMEHVYNLPDFMQRITDSLKDNGIVIAEVPETWAYSYKEWPHLLDFHQPHVNHFTDFSLDLLFANYGYKKFDEFRAEYPIINIPTYRAGYVKNGLEYMYDKIKMKLINYTDEIVRKLRRIKEPVIIYGLGDLAWHIIAESPTLNIVGLVDNNEAYKGCKINGIPVLDKIVTDDTILVMAQGQKLNILDKINKLGLTNKVIDIDELEW